MESVKTAKKGPCEKLIAAKIKDTITINPVINKNGNKCFVEF